MTQPAEGELRVLPAQGDLLQPFRSAGSFLTSEARFVQIWSTGTRLEHNTRDAVLGGFALAACRRCGRRGALRSPLLHLALHRTGGISKGTEGANLRIPLGCGAGARRSVGRASPASEN